MIICKSAYGHLALLYLLGNLQTTYGGEMKYIINMILIYWILIGYPWQATAQELKQQPIEYGHYTILHSDILNEDRRLLVMLPDNYSQTNTRYPVLYKLDGHPDIFYQTCGVVWYLSGLAEAIPPHIVIGIENTDRFRDMKWDLPNPFLEFIEKELIPFVSQTYRTHDFRILSGQSYSGNYTTFVFLNKPTLFDAYIINSFGFSESNMKEVESYLKTVTEAHLSPTYVWCCNGGQDTYDPKSERTQRAEALIQKLTILNIPNLIMQYKFYPEEGHVPYPGQYEGLKWIYAKQNKGGK